MDTLNHEIAQTFMELEADTESLARVNPFTVVTDGQWTGPSQYLWSYRKRGLELLSRAICHAHGLYVREKFQPSTVREA